MFKLMDLIPNVFQGLSNIVDELHTSDEERQKLQVDLAKANMTITQKMLELQGEVLAAQSKIIVAEAKGQSWLQRNWRPVCMLTFLILICCDSFGLLTFRLSEQAWELLKIGLGGYVIGRSIEKTAPSITQLFKGSKD